jgi:sugar lactone lactonase YvrE
MIRTFRPLLALATLALFALLGTALAQAQPGGQANVTILVDLNPDAATGIRIEGLVSDKQGRLYTSDLDSRNFYRIDPAGGTATVMGQLPRAASGMAFDAAGNLFFASNGSILRLGADILAGNSITATNVTTVATGLTGSNGLAFGPNGALYVSGGATGNIYVVHSDGMTGTWATGFTSNRQDQAISTNGLAFGPDGLLYSSNTGTGAIDRIPVNADGTAGQVQRFVTSTLLLGADGITFAANGDLYVAANERNAIVRVTQAGQVSDVASNGNAGPLEFPASPSFSGNALYASNFDIARGANAPNDGGIGASIARIAVGVEGAPLPATGGVQPTAAATPPAGTPAATPPAVECAGDAFTAAATGAREVPPNDSTATGSGNFCYDPATGMISYNFTYQGGFTTSETAAHLHRGAVGTAGPVIVPLPTGTTKTGSAPFPTADVENLRAGNVYINVHSVQFPGGEIRGQLVPLAQAATPTTVPIPTIAPTVAPPPTEVLPPAPTPEPPVVPGMPTTGGGGDSSLLFLIVLAVVGTVAFGLVARRASRRA